MSKLRKAIVDHHSFFFNLGGSGDRLLPVFFLVLHYTNSTICRRTSTGVLTKTACSSRPSSRQAAARFPVPVAAEASSPSPTKTTPGKGRLRCRRASHQDNENGSHRRRRFVPKPDSSRPSTPASSKTDPVPKDEAANKEDDSRAARGGTQDATSADADTETKYRRWTMSRTFLTATPSRIAFPTAELAPQ